MQNAIKKYRILDPPDDKKNKNKIIQLGGRAIQNEMIKIDAVKDLEENNNYHAGLRRMNYELLAENERLRKKCNNVVRSYNNLIDNFNKLQKKYQKVVLWLREKCKKYFKLKKKKYDAWLKKKKINIKENKNGKGKINS